MSVTRAADRVEAAPRVPRQVGVVWGLLLLNTLGYTDVATIFPLARPVAQVVTMGALLLALGLAIALNPRLQVRRSAYLTILTLLLVASVASSLRLESGLGALFRCFRGSVFLATLWLLTPWWRGDLRFVRHHVRALVVVLISVAAGLVMAPGLARPGLYGGRLVGVLWPIPPTQVGQYAAVVTGLAAMLWATRQLERRVALWIMAPALVLLLLSHTRTALFALLVGVAGALVSLVLSSARARRLLFGSLVIGGLAVVALRPFLTRWLARGQDTQQLNSLTGRQVVWNGLLHEHRSLSDQLMGVGLTNKSFGGLPIDSSWLAVYQDQGYVGLVLVGALMLSMLGAVLLRGPSPGGACAVFLVLYVAVASYTEVGLGDASPYWLHLAAAASLLARPAEGRPRAVLR